MNTVAQVIGYAVMLGAGIAAAGTAWYVLINEASKFLGTNQKLFAAAWLILREPELVEETRRKHFEQKT